MGNASGKGLIVFDLNHVLCHVVHRKDYKKAQKRHGGRLRRPDIVIRGCYYVYKRPHLDEFLKFVFSEYSLASWSSKESFNADAILGALLTETQQEGLIASYYREMMTERGDSVTKDLNCIWMLDKCPFGVEETMCLEAVGRSTITDEQKDCSLLVPYYSYEKKNEASDEVLLHLIEYLKSCNKKTKNSGADGFLEFLEVK
jgi:TFIIF-interacting CTD phosphatase-like protein